MAFELREHTADVAVSATGDRLADVFGATGNGLAAAMCESIPPSRGEERFSLSVVAESRDALLYDYLAELIYERDVRGVLPVDNQVSIEPPATAGDDGDGIAGEWRLEASARGVSLSAIDAREVKAVTYSEMAIAETAEGWRAYVVFDV